MSKPWDKLRKPISPPLMEGEWRFTRSGSTCGWYQVEPRAVNIFIDGHKIGGPAAGPTGMWIQSARELGEFLIELADQLESQ